MIVEMIHVSGDVIIEGDVHSDAERAACLHAEHLMI